MKLVSLMVLCLGVVGCNRADTTGSTPVESDETATKAAESPAAKADTPATKESDDPHAAFEPLDVDRVASLLEKEEAVPVDANNADTRKELGTLPGAILLSDAKGYDVSELPEDKSKKLVFYCGSERCLSAPKAAKRAEAAGYDNVHVMPAGIRGWVKAGKQVDKTS